MFEVKEKPRMVERALLVGVHYPKSDPHETTSLLSELADLVETLMAETEAVLNRLQS